MNVFSGVTSTDLGDVNAAGIIESGLSLIVVLGPIVLIGLAIAFAPKVIGLIKRSAK